jgi:uncharacterized membrane protein
VIRESIEFAAQMIEILAVGITISFILIGTARWLFHSAREIAGTYERYRVVLGKAILVGLELLVAADIIRTVVLEMTLANIGSLGCLVLVRTFLGWTLSVEVEGHWPWQGEKEPHRESGARTPVAEITAETA